MTQHQQKSGPWRIFDVFTDIEIVTDRPTANETESIVQFKGQRNARAHAELIVRAVNSHEHLIRACRLLVQAYAKGAKSEHVEWDDLNIAHDAADLALGIADDHQQLPPDQEKMNGDRAEWAAAALRQFQRATGCDYEDNLGDLLCDLMHWSDRSNFDFEAALCRARGHYAAETSAGPP